MTLEDTLRNLIKEVKKQNIEVDKMEKIEKILDKITGKKEKNNDFN